MVMEFFHQEYVVSKQEMQETPEKNGTSFLSTTGGIYSYWTYRLVSRIWTATHSSSVIFCSMNRVYNLQGVKSTNRCTTQICDRRANLFVIFVQDHVDPKTHLTSPPHRNPFQTNHQSAHMQGKGTVPLVTFHHKGISYTMRRTHLFGRQKSSKEFMSLIMGSVDKKT